MNKIFKNFKQLRNKPQEESNHTHFLLSRSLFFEEMAEIRAKI